MVAVGDGVGAKAIVVVEDAIRAVSVVVLAYSMRTYSSIGGLLAYI